MALNRVAVAKFLGAFLAVVIVGWHFIVIFPVMRDLKAAQAGDKDSVSLHANPITNTLTITFKDNKDKRGAELANGLVDGMMHLMIPPFEKAVAKGFRKRFDVYSMIVPWSVEIEHE